MNTPVRQQIIDKIAEMLLDITVASGNYNFTILEVNKEDVSIDNIKQFPAVNILVGPDTYLNPTANEAGRLIKTLNVTLDCYLDEVENKQAEAAKFVADIELRFHNDTPGETSAYNLEGKCLTLLPVDSVIFDIMSTSDKFGIEHQMDVKYRQSRKDPTLLY